MAHVTVVAMQCNVMLYMQTVYADLHADLCAYAVCGCICAILLWSTTTPRCICCLQDDLGLNSAVYRAMLARVPLKPSHRLKELQYQQASLHENAQRLQDHMTNTTEMQAQGLIGSVTCRAVITECTNKLKVNKKNLVGTQKAITEMTDRGKRRQEAEAWVMRVVAQGLLAARSPA